MRSNGRRGMPSRVIAEPALTKMLRELPVAVIITKRENDYAWQFLQGNGIAKTYMEALREALTYLQATRMTE